MKNTRDLHLEISSVATVITGIGNQFDGANTCLTDESLRLAFYGLSNYLDSIGYSQAGNPVVESYDQETFNPQRIR